MFCISCSLTNHIILNIISRFTNCYYISYTFYFNCLW